MVKLFKAFSLVEVMISMIIVSVIGAAMLPVITKSKPEIDVQTLRGQYACWWAQADAYDPAVLAGTALPTGPANTLYEQYFDERTPRTDVPVKINISSGATCSLRFDQRPANFYIAAVGAGSAHEAELRTFYTPVLSQELKIIPGLPSSVASYPGSRPSIFSSNIRDTMILNADNSIFAQVRGGLSSNPPVVTLENIEKCVIQEFAPSDDCRSSAKKCDITEVSTGTYSVRLSGCLNEADTSYGSYGADSRIFKSLSTLSYQNMLRTASSANINVDFNNVSTSGNLTIRNASTGLNYINDRLSYMQLLSSHNNIAYGYHVTGAQYTKLNFILKDDYYRNPANLFGISNNGVHYNYGSANHKAKMMSIIETVSPRRQTKLLTDYLPPINAGASIYSPYGGNKGGAVIVLW